MILWVWRRNTGHLETQLMDFTGQEVEETCNLQSIQKLKLSEWCRCGGAWNDTSRKQSCTSAQNLSNCNKLHSTAAHCITSSSVVCRPPAGQEAVLWAESGPCDHTQFTERPIRAERSDTVHRAGTVSTVRHLLIHSLYLDVSNNYFHCWWICWSSLVWSLNVSKCSHVTSWQRRQAGPCSSADL